MRKQAMALLALLVVLTVGGFFIYNRWQVVEVEIEQEVAEIEDASGLKSIALEVEKVIEESAELIEETQKFLQEQEEKKMLIGRALEKSSEVKGVYINEFVANFQTPFAKTYRQNLQKLLDETELNAAVIDIKENNGPNLVNSLKTFINELHQKDVWVIARICAFRDSSLREKKPEWYLKDASATSSDNIWRDASGASWLDPGSEAVQQYLIDFSKKAVDFGFDELQFDYIRFPSDGSVQNIVYPFYNGTTTKHEVIRDFFSKLSQALKDYQPSVILSADLFGYLATQFQSFDIGQRLSDAGQYFDYVSFMLYPSHFYGGFAADYDAKRELPSLNFPFEDETTTSTNNLVSNNPYPVILRSVFSSIDHLSLYGLSAKVRPWLQDFNLSYDVARDIIYNADKVKAQIQGAKDAGSAGWLLWNSANIYTGDALEKIAE